MDLIYTCHTSTTKRRRRRNAPVAIDGLSGLPPSSPTAASICCVSPRNVLLFTTSSQSHLPKGACSIQESSSSVHEFGVENGGNGGGISASAAKHSVFVCDLNTPWEVRHIDGLDTYSPVTRAGITQPLAQFFVTK